MGDGDAVAGEWGCAGEGLVPGVEKAKTPAGRIGEASDPTRLSRPQGRIDHPQPQPPPIHPTRRLSLSLSLSQLRSLFSSTLLFDSPLYTTYTTFYRRGIHACTRIFLPFRGFAKSRNDSSTFRPGLFDTMRKRNFIPLWIT